MVELLGSEEKRSVEDQDSEFSELDKYKLNSRIDNLATQFNSFKDSVTQKLLELQTTQSESEQDLHKQIENVRDEFTDELNKLADTEQEHRELASQQLRQVVYLIISTIITLILQKFF